MSIYIELPLLAVVVVYVIDLSGFTTSWRGFLARRIGLRDDTELRPLPPFDCGKCMTFWVCLLFAALTHRLDLPVLAFCALLSMLSDTISGVLLFIHELLDFLLERITPR